jgi:hypothetical protein
MTTLVTESKLESESYLLAVDFLSDLRPGETIIGASTNVTVSVGVDPNPLAMLSGSASISGSITSQRLIGGVPGVIYTIWSAIKTSTTNVFVTKTQLAVLSDDAIVPP